MAMTILVRGLLGALVLTRGLASGAPTAPLDLSLDLVCLPLSVTPDTDPWAIDPERTVEIDP